MIFTRSTSEQADVNSCTSLPKTVGSTCYGHHGEQEMMSLVPIMEPNFSAAWAVYSRYTEKGPLAHGAQIWISFDICNRLENVFIKLEGRQHERK